MKKHLVEIISFWLYHDIARPINNLIKDKKNLIFEVIFSFETQLNLSDFLFFEKKFR